jgi:hypothetical protein
MKVGRWKMEDGRKKKEERRKKKESRSKTIIVSLSTTSFPRRRESTIENGFASPVRINPRVPPARERRKSGVRYLFQKNVY